MSTMPTSTDKLLEDAVEAIGEVSVRGCPPGVGYLFDAPKVREIVYSAIMAKLHGHGLKVQGSCGHEAKLAIAGRLATELLEWDEYHGHCYSNYNPDVRRFLELARNFKAAK